MTDHPSSTGALRVTAVGGPTALLELGGVRLLTDPAFDPPGGDYPTPGGYSLVKTAGPAVAAADLGPVDVVLLFHDHHTTTSMPRAAPTCPRPAGC